MEEKTKIYDLKERTFVFSKDMIEFVKSSPHELILHSPVDQLLRSATAIGANVTKGKAGPSKEDFLRFSTKALRSAKETEYWLRLVQETSVIEDIRLEQLIKENDEIIRILVSIIVKNK